jgi:hypothetical protein
MQRRAEAHANTREQQRWRREQSDSKSLYESIKPDKAISLPFDELRIPDGVDAKGDPKFKTVRGQHEVAAGCHEHWKALFNETDWRPDEEATRRMLEPILQDTSRHLDAATAASLTIDKIFTPLMISKALDAIRKGTMPGGTGITTDLLAHRAWRKRMAAHLVRLACKLFGNEKLTPNMREAIVSILFKGKGVRDLCTSHRPVSLTDAEPPSTFQQLLRRPTRGYDLGHMASDVVGLMDALSIASAHVMGMSMGGMIAQTLAARHAERMKSLTSRSPGSSLCGMTQSI